MTQQQLAHCVGLRFQQIQKYESARNRVSASKLFEIATAQSVAVSYYFDGLTVLKSEGVSESRESGAVIYDREGAEFVKFVSRLPHNRRRRLIEITRQIAG